MAWIGTSIDHGLFLHVFEPNDGCTYENAHKVTGEVILQSFYKSNGFLEYLTGHVHDVVVQMDTANTHTIPPILALPRYPPSLALLFPETRQRYDRGG